VRIFGHLGNRRSASLPSRRALQLTNILRDIDGTQAGTCRARRCGCGVATDEPLAAAVTRLTHACVARLRALANISRRPNPS
jgi:hypothetical protein